MCSDLFVIQAYHVYMSRFNVGDRVTILPVATTPFVGLNAIVHIVQPHERNITILDRYIVEFEWGEKQSFFDVQLAHA